MNQNVFNQLLVRIKSESPTLFKRLQWLFFGLSGAIITLIFLTPLHLNLHGLEGYVNWNTVMVLLGFAGVSLLPVKDDTTIKVKKLMDDEPPAGGSGTETPTKPPGTP